jgi:hypothetical protein
MTTYEVNVLFEVHQPGDAKCGRVMFAVKVQLLVDGLYNAHLQNEKIETSITLKDCSFSKARQFN